MDPVMPSPLSHPRSPCQTGRARWRGGCGVYSLGGPERASGGRVQSLCVRIYHTSRWIWRMAHRIHAGNTLSFHAPWEAGEYDA